MKTQKKEWWTEQKRDANGLFLSYDGTKPPKKLYTRQDIQYAWLAGNNDTGGFLSKSRKLQIFMDKV